jgi:hypothetical protein
MEAYLGRSHLNPILAEWTVFLLGQLVLCVSFLPETLGVCPYLVRQFERLEHEVFV